MITETKLSKNHIKKQFLKFRNEDPIQQRVLKMFETNVALLLDISTKFDVKSSFLLNSM